MTQRWPRETLDPLFEEARLQGKVSAKLPSLEEAASLKWALQHRKAAHPPGFSIFLNKADCVVTLTRRTLPVLEIIREKD